MGRIELERRNRGRRCKSGRQRRCRSKMAAVLRLEETRKQGQIRRCQAALTNRSDRAPLLVMGVRGNFRFDDDSAKAPQPALRRVNRYSLGGYRDTMKVAFLLSHANEYVRCGRTGKSTRRQHRRARQYMAR